MKPLISLLTIVTTSLLSGCGSLMFSLANAPAHFGNYKRTTDLPYGTDPRQRLDVYEPKTAGLRPVVIFWYGGSWTKGTKTDYRFIGAALAERGFVTVLPDYRLYPEVKFPFFVEDGAQAVAWVQQHVHEFGGDPNHIVLMGHSAGAHEAALLALDHRYLKKAGAKPKSIVGLIGMSGPYQLTPNSQLLNIIFADPYKPDDWQPVHYVDADSPPTLLMHGGDDDVVSVEHANNLEIALKKAGIPVEKIIYPSKGHAATAAGFISLVPSRLPTLDESVRFIQRVTASGTGSATRTTPGLYENPRAQHTP